MEQENKTVLQALFKAKQEFSTIRKDRNNPVYRSKYSTLESILLAIEPALTKNNLMITQYSYVRADFVEIKQEIEYIVPEALINNAKKPIPKSSKTSYKLPVVVLVTKIIHLSGEFIQSELPLVQEDTNPQDLGKISSYVRRYAILALISEVPSEREDDDGRFYRTKSLPKTQDSSVQQNQSSEFNSLIQAINQEMTRLGWSNIEGRRYLERNYGGKTTRQQMTMEELKDFLKKLRLIQVEQTLNVTHEEVN